MNKTSLIRNINTLASNRSAWSRGLKIYALELVENLGNMKEYPNATLLKKGLLNGASDWTQYSEGGCALIYDCDIAERLCNPSELKRTKGGLLYPNKYENWIDVQSRALVQACNLVVRAYKRG